MKDTNLLDAIINGDSLTVLKTLPDESVDCCVTSPPYYALRDYGVNGQIGRESTPSEYIARLTEVFREVRRVLKKTVRFGLTLQTLMWGQVVKQAPPTLNIPKAEVAKTICDLPVFRIANPKI